MANRRLVISGYPEGTTSDQLMMYFQSKESGGGDVEGIQVQEGQAVVTFEREEGTFTLGFVYSFVCLINMLLNQFAYHKTLTVNYTKQKGSQGKPEIAR